MVTEGSGEEGADEQPEDPGDQGLERSDQAQGGTGGQQPAATPARPTSVAVGMSLNVEVSRKYGFDASAATRVTAKLVAIPPPPQLMSLLSGEEQSTG